MPVTHLDAGHLGPHSPLALDDLSRMMLGAPFRWCLVGGLAIDRALGRSTRPHSDLDVAIFRREQDLVRDWLAAWELWYGAAPGSGLHRLGSQDVLPGDAHEIWCRRLANEPWRLEILVEESTADSWVYRRNHRITLPIGDLIRPIEGVPVMAPEVVLLYKAKNPRNRDLADFNAALPLLDAGGRDWLRAAVSEAHPDCPWLAEL